MYVRSKLALRTRYSSLSSSPAYETICGTTQKYAHPDTACSQSDSVGIYQHISHVRPSVHQQCSTRSSLPKRTPNRRPYVRCARPLVHATRGAFAPRRANQWEVSTRTLARGPATLGRLSGESGCSAMAFSSPIGALPTTLGLCTEETMRPATSESMCETIFLR